MECKVNRRDFFTGLGLCAIGGTGLTIPHISSSGKKKDMADELKLQVTANLTKGNYTSKFEPGLLSITVDAVGGHHPVVDVGTSEEVISFGDISTEGWCFMRNLDDTNYVQWGPESGGSMITMGRIEAGEVACFRMEPGITLRAKANTAAVLLEFWLIED